MALTNPDTSSATTPSVSPQTVKKAVDSLLKWRTSKSQSEKSQLLDQEYFIYLIVTLKKIPPKGRTNPYKIPLPHSLHSEISELCLFIDDRAKSQLNKDAAKKKFQSENIPVSKIIKFTKLKTDYRPFEAKRKLCDSYDMFFADKRVIPLLPKLLGKHFFKKKKIPVPIDLKHKNWKEQIEKACGSALLYLKTGTCSVLKVAKASMEGEEIAENVIAAINGIAEIVPKKWGNVRSLHLKLLESVALPIYQAVPDMKLKIEGEKEEEEVMEVDSSKENNKDESKVQKVKKVGKKKGRIHEVRYMDNNIGEIFDADELGSDDGEEIGDIKTSKIEEIASDKLKGKKRNRGDGAKEGVLNELKKGVLSELNGEKKLRKSTRLKSKEDVKEKKNELSDKGKKNESIKQKKEKLSVKGGESAAKKEKKSGHLKLKAGGTKVKTRKL